MALGNYNGNGGSLEGIFDDPQFSESLINGLPGIFYIHVLNDRYSLVKCNNNYKTVTGLEEHELSETSLFDLFDESEYEFIQFQLEKLKNQGEIRLEAHLKTKSGKLIPYYFEAHIFKKSNQSYLIGLGLDMTNQVAYREALVDSEEKYRTLVESFSDIILISDLEGNLLFTNRALDEHTGLQVGDLSIVLKDNPAIHPEDADYVKTIVDNFLGSNQQQSQPIVNRFLDNKNTIFWYSAVVSKVKYHRKEALQIISRDITDKKRIDQAFHENEEQLSALFESAPVIMMLIDEAGKVLRINKKGEEILGSKMLSDAGISIGNTLHCINSYKSEKGCGQTDACGICKLRKALNSTFYEGVSVYKEELQLGIFKDNTMKPSNFLVSTTLINTAAQNLVLVTLDDITTQKKLELDLTEAKNKAEESDRLKSSFLQNMSHEIRTPMNGIIGFCDLLNTPSLSAGDISQYTSIISESSKQLLSIVDNILEISQIENNQTEVFLEDVKVDALLNEIFFQYEPRAKMSGLRLIKKTSSKVQHFILNTDNTKIQRVLKALLDNAIKFTSDGEVVFGCDEKNGVYEFFVSDTGIGIEPELQELVFERFRQADMESTRNYGGTGLGLTIAKALIQLLGGQIWLHSAKNQGTCFYFTLPANYAGEKKAIQVKPYSGRKETSRNRPRVLVAEDDETNFLLIEEYLSQIDSCIEHATNGSEAVGLFHKIRDFDFILMDIKMPELNGFEATREIRKIDDKVPIIALTAYTSTKDRLNALEAGVNEFLTKPVIRENLFEVINNYW